jgi:hypothetical protein
MKEADPKVQPLMDSLRKFCFSLGSNVVEDVRMHRVVFCKSFAFRWFVDIAPHKWGKKATVLLKIQMSRSKTQICEIILKEDLDGNISWSSQQMKVIQEGIREAYDSIH